ncbi:LysE family transporter [Arcicella sp. LKC2W]|uniref:LysE family translocator n=1 Tax=Arcicella sp. LKC2W TaxID=2984198 RepID=UPI002B210EC9|nr:LysE family transporter [Arcicella sp. LKC2W]MEA5457968.1 LysE family transporter [Arcicella sp. LKC2W]
MKTLTVYFITALISYVATIPPGPLSVFVAHTALQKNIKIAFWVALGGVLCESSYAYLAIEGVKIFDKYPMVEFWMQRAIIGILLTVGIITFFQKSITIKSEEVSLNSRFFSFFKGISLSLFNPALLPFWVVVLLSYQKYDFLKIETVLEKTSFVLGAGTGTFLLVYTYAFIANRKRDLIFQYITDSRLNKLIGCIFISLAILQLVNLLA